MIAAATEIKLIQRTSPVTVIKVKPYLSTEQKINSGMKSINHWFTIQKSEALISLFPKNPKPIHTPALPFHRPVSYV